MISLCLGKRDGSSGALDEEEEEVNLGHDGWEGCIELPNISIGSYMYKDSDKWEHGKMGEE